MSIQRWYPDFNSLDVSAMITLIWVRFLNLPLHLSSHDSLETIGNCLGRFVKSGTERVSKGLATFAHICVELDLSKGLPDKIFIDWGGPKPHLQLLDFEYIAFQWRSCLQPGHLQEACPTAPVHMVKRRPHGWHEGKPHRIKSTSQPRGNFSVSSQPHPPSRIHYPHEEVSPLGAPKKYIVL